MTFIFIFIFFFESQNPAYDLMPRQPLVSRDHGVGLATKETNKRNPHQKYQDPSMSITHTG